MTDAKNAVNSKLVVTLPVTDGTPAETLDIANFTAEGTAVRSNFVDNDRVKFKIATDGTAEAFNNPNELMFIEFTITPLSEIDKKLTKFKYYAKGKAIIVNYEDKNFDLSFVSEKAFLKTAPDDIVAPDPDYKTYRIELAEYVIS